VQRDPAGVPAHDLDDERAVVRLGGGVQPVDGVDGDLHRGVEAEGVVGGAEVVVDRLRDADDVQAGRGQLGRDAEGVLAADRDQRVDAGLLEVAADLLDAVLDLHDVGPAAAEDGAAAREDAPGLLHAERHREPSSGPFQPSRKPRNSCPCTSTPFRTTARMTAFRPGQSPPPVRTPMRTAVLPRRASADARQSSAARRCRSGLRTPTTTACACCVVRR
jgi:hypothetical protein